MVVSDYTLTIASSFKCNTPQSAAPGAKGACQLPKVYNVREPHCTVEMELGTRGVLCDKTNANHYMGHVPDAPCMLGDGRGRLYAKATSDTRLLGPGRLGAFAGCLGVSLMVASLGVGGLYAVASLLHAMAPATVGAVGLGAVRYAASLVTIVTCAVLCGNENVAWQQAHERFGDLSALADAHMRARGAGFSSTKAHAEADKLTLRAGLASEDFAVQHAALELLAVSGKDDVPLIHKA